MEGCHEKCKTFVGKRPRKMMLETVLYSGNQPDVDKTWTRFWTPLRDVASGRFRVTVTKSVRPLWGNGLKK